MKISKKVLALLSGVFAIYAWDYTVPQGVPWSAFPFLGLAAVCAYKAFRK